MVAGLAAVSGPARTNACLCRRVREYGDHEAFAELVRRHQRQLRTTVYGFAWTISAGYAERDDLEQETLIGFWRAAEVFEPDRCVPYGAVAAQVARRRLIDMVRDARREKERANREAARLDQQLSDETDGAMTLGDTIPAPAAFWEPELVAEIRHDLRILSTELPTSLSSTEREALTRVMLDERHPGNASSAMRRLRAKASAALGYEWRAGDRRSAQERKQRAFALLARGATVADAASAVGVTKECVRLWKRQADRDQLEVAA